MIDQKLGAVLGVLCALGIALGGFESMREQRSAGICSAVAPTPARPARRTRPPAAGPDAGRSAPPATDAPGAVTGVNV